MNYNTIKAYARNLRKQQTKAENKLWKEIRNRKINGRKFLRQHPILYQTLNNTPKFFIADFYCAKKKLVIELDGRIHENQQEYDKNRDEIMEYLDLKVLRFKNEELKDMENVLKKIRENLI